MTVVEAYRVIVVVIEERPEFPFYQGVVFLALFLGETTDEGAFAVVFEGFLAQPAEIGRLVEDGRDCWDCQKLVQVALKAWMISPRLHCIGSNTSMTPWKWSGMQMQACTATLLPWVICLEGIASHSCWTFSPSGDR